MKNDFKRIANFGRTRVSIEIMKIMDVIDVKIVCEENGKEEPCNLTFNDNIADTINKNRHFLTVKIAGKNYVDFFDPGSQVTIVGPAIANRFRNRIEDGTSSIKTTLAPQPLTKTLGQLNINFSIGSTDKSIKQKAVGFLNNDLGMDFKTLWKIEERIEDDIWK